MYSDNSSKMKEKFILQTLVATPNEYGEDEETWTDGPVLRGSYEPLKAGEYFSNAALPQRDAQVDARIRVRFRRGINPGKHRLVYGGVIQDIKGVIADRKRNQLQIMVAAKAVEQGDGATVNA